MQTRSPAVAGMFYEATAPRLEAQVAACLAAAPSSTEKERFIGAVVPHAGLMYSGRVAAAFYAIAELPKRLIILGPNHTGLGHFAAINRAGRWRTPLGDVPVDTTLADALLRQTRVLRDDAAAHAREHSLEVQLPFLQVVLGSFTFVPICLGAPRYEMCEEVGAAMAAVIEETPEPVAILASSDLNHYEDQQTTEKKDQLAIDRVVARDPAGLWQGVDEHDVSMCGYIPTTAMLLAANALRAKQGRLLEHATSGDVNGDYGHVVGYAAIIVQ